MRSVEIIATGEGRLALYDAAIPVPKPGEALIRIAYAGVNHADIFQRQGLYPPPEGAPNTPGLEVSGVVTETNACTRFKPGDIVCALLPGGGYAEYCTVDERLCLPVPEGFTLKEAASLPEAWATVWLALMEKAKIQSGETILIQGGASGIGTAAIQLAKLKSLRVLATAGTAEKCETVRAVGADRVYNYRSDDFTEEPVDVVLDMVGGDYIAKHVKLLKRGGRLVMLAFLNGSRTDASLAPLVFRELSLFGFTLRGQSIEAKRLILQALERELWPHFASERLKPVIDAVFPLEQAAQAHAHMEAGKHIGKIMLKIND